MNRRSLKKTQFFSELFILLGYLFGLIPFSYATAVWWVLPLTVLSLYVSNSLRVRNNLLYKINFIFAIFSIVPVLGYLTRFGGIVISTKHILETYDNINF